ncbi:MAG: metallophosphoesterase [Oscillospiraceae bacterium]|nr:metallophosphoesterase [Oscillospiraceae bacterium]MBQ6159500.1 metallophosphoesterase [Oscillospiraceae bacterium]
MKKSTVAAAAAVLGTAAAAASVPYFYRQNTELTASHYVFRSPKVQGALEGFRITQVSDLHNREFGKENCRLLALTEAQLPDLLVITGDLMDSYHTDLDKALDSARRLAKLAPCYYVTGNHEHRMSEARQADFYQGLEEAGVIPLRNEAVGLGLGTGFRLVGVDCNQGRTETLKRLMADRPPEELNILLAHKPHYAKYYERAGVDLVLTGHAHGGQWRLPGIGGLYAPGQGVIPRYTAGMYRLGNTVMCVSRGLGNSSFPLRIENKPELVTVILRGEQK